MAIKLVARTAGQRDYIWAVNGNTITICHGPAGSGKTYLACALAAKALYRKDVSRIVLSRPIASCGQEIGFLPGSVEEKIAPYLTPLYDELGNFFSVKELRMMLDSGIIEIVPLAMMRGRTFRNSFVILDEAQNAIYDEIRMFLTRLGPESKMVLNGDASQSDVTGDAFVHITRKLKAVDDIGIVALTDEDIVRHGLISKIIKALSCS